MLKRNLLKVLSLAVIFCLILATATFAEVKSAEAVKGTPVIDGEIDAIWADAKEINVDTVSYAWGMIDTSTKGKVKTLWDENFLYVLGIVNDAVVSNSNPEALWQRDSMDFFIDQDNNETGTEVPLNDNSGFFSIGAKDDQFNLSGMMGNAAKDDFKFKTKLIDGGYLIEVAIPWSSLKGKAAPGTVIGFDVQINDDLGNGKRESIIVWNDTTSNGFRWVDGYGDLKLVDAPKASGAAVAESKEEVKTETKKEAASNPKTGDVSIISFVVIATAAVCGMKKIKK